MIILILSRLNQIYFSKSVLIFYSFKFTLLQNQNKTKQKDEQNTFFSCFISLYFLNFRERRYDDDDDDRSIYKNFIQTLTRVKQLKSLNCLLFLLLFTL